MVLMDQPDGRVNVKVRDVELVPFCRAEEPDGAGAVSMVGID